MTSVLVTGPTTEPIELNDAKKHLNVDFDDDDDLITAMLKAARQSAERFMGRALIDQTWDVFLDEFPGVEFLDIKLVPAPVIEVLSVGYGPDYATELDPATYIVDKARAPGRLGLTVGGSWPTVIKAANAIRIRLRAGYVDTETSPVTGEVPYDIRAAILLTLGSLYAHRENIVIGQTPSVLPWGAEQLLRPHRIHTGMA